MFSRSKILIVTTLLFSLSLNSLSASSIQSEEPSQESWRSWIYRGTVEHVKNHVTEYILTTCATALATASYMALASGAEEESDEGMCLLSETCFSRFQNCEFDADSPLVIYALNLGREISHLYSFINGTFTGSDYGFLNVTSLMRSYRPYEPGTRSYTYYLVEQINENLCRYVFAPNYDDQSIPLATSDWTRRTL